MSSEKSVPGVAVPLGVTLTVIGVSLGLESETVNVAVAAGSPVLPSFTVSGVEFVIETTGAVSSLVIVPVRCPCPVAIAELTEFERLSLNA